MPSQGKPLRYLHQRREKRLDVRRIKTVLDHPTLAFPWLAVGRKHPCKAQLARGVLEPPGPLEAVGAVPQYGGDCFWIGNDDELPSRHPEPEHIAILAVTLLQGLVHGLQADSQRTTQ